MHRKLPPMLVTNSSNAAVRQILPLAAADGSCVCALDNGTLVKLDAQGTDIQPLLLAAQVTLLPTVELLLWNQRLVLFAVKSNSSGLLGFDILCYDVVTTQVEEVAVPLAGIAEAFSSTTTAVELHSMALDASGRKLVLGTSDRKCRVFTLMEDEGEKRLRATCQLTLCGHAGPVYCVRFDHRGDRVASCSKDGTLRVWPVPQSSYGDHNYRQTTLRVQQPPEGNLGSLSWSADDRKIAVGSRTGTHALLIVDVDMGMCEHVARGHSQPIESTVTSVGGQLVATASSDGTARVWNLRTGQCVHTFSSLPGGAAWCVAWSSDASRLFVGCGEGSVQTILFASAPELEQVAAQSSLCILKWNQCSSRYIVMRLAHRRPQQQIVEYIDEDAFIALPHEKGKVGCVVWLQERGSHQFWAEVSWRDVDSPGGNTQASQQLVVECTGGTSLSIEVKELAMFTARVAWNGSVLQSIPRQHAAWVLQALRLEFIVETLAANACTLQHPTVSLHGEADLSAGSHDLQGLLPGGQYRLRARLGLATAQSPICAYEATFSTLSLDDSQKALMHQFAEQMQTLQSLSSDCATLGQLLAATRLDGEESLEAHASASNTNTTSTAATLAPTGSVENLAFLESLAAASTSTMAASSSLSSSSSSPFSSSLRQRVTEMASSVLTLAHAAEQRCQALLQEPGRRTYSQANTVIATLREHSAELVADCVAAVRTTLALADADDSLRQIRISAETARSRGLPEAERATLEAQAYEYAGARLRASECASSAPLPAMQEWVPGSMQQSQHAALWSQLEHECVAVRAAAQESLEHATQALCELQARVQYQSAQNKQECEELLRRLEANRLRQGYLDGLAHQLAGQQDRLEKIRATLHVRTAALDRAAQVPSWFVGEAQRLSCASLASHQETLAQEAKERQQCIQASWKQLQTELELAVLRHVVMEETVDKLSSEMSKLQQAHLHDQVQEKQQQLDDARARAIRFQDEWKGWESRMFDFGTRFLPAPIQRPGDVQRMCTQLKRNVLTRECPNASERIVAALQLPLLDAAPQQLRLSLDTSALASGDSIGSSCAITPRSGSATTPASIISGVQSLLATYLSFPPNGIRLKKQQLLVTFEAPSATEDAAGRISCLACVRQCAAALAAVTSNAVTINGQSVDNAADNCDDEEEFEVAVTLPGVVATSGSKLLESLPFALQQQQAAM